MHIIILLFFRNAMYKELFVANEVLQGCLIHVRSLLEAASSSRDGIGEKDSAIILIVLDKSNTMTLDEFKAIQAGQAEKALGQLNSLRNKIIDIVWESCAVSLSIYFKLCYVMLC
jgi:dynein heavy chain